MIEIPNIELGAPIGEGAFGDVYRARHLTFDVDVAVKLIRPADVGPGAEDALKEARLMARLDHPNLLRIFDAGKRAGVLYLVFELMDGSCSDLRSLPADRALDVTMQLLAGLQALHDARVLHRDIKPANCLLRARDRRVKLADLGIAIERATRSYQAADLSGTLPFMAPELFDHPARFGVASDLYALGITLQCLVLDEIPYPRTSRTELMAWILGGTLPELARRRPDLPPSLSGLIERLSARAAGDRPASAAAALAQLASGSASPARRADSGNDPTLQVIGAWVIGPEITTDGNFRHHAVTHLHTGAPGRLTALRPARPLSDQSSLILASAQRASKLSHPGIGDVIDWGMHENRAYVVTRPHGQSLKAVVKASGPLPELEAVELAGALADALDYLHREGLVYQILTPASATLSADAQSAQLAWPVFCVPIGSSSDPSAGTSFNISVPRFAAPESLVRPGRAATAPPPPGTAPERIGRYDVVRDLGDATPLPGIQPAVDLYGLGETLYYLLAGKPAFSKTPFLTTLLLEKMRGPADVRAAAPATTGPTAQLVAELTAPLAKDRPKSAASVRDQLDRVVERLRS